MKIIDISISFEEGMMKYPSLLPFERKWLRSFENGDPNQVSYIQTPSHNGTHVDAPCHYIEGGKTMDDIPLERFYGDAQVIEVPESYESVSKEFLLSVDIKADKLLFKTSNTKYRMDEFDPEYVYIEPEASQYMVDQGVKLVGVDYVSVDPKVSPDKPSHMILLGNEVIILEAANLKDVDEGVYTLMAFPIKVTGAEGSLCRAVLIAE